MLCPCFFPPCFPCTLQHFLEPALRFHELLVVREEHQPAWPCREARQCRGRLLRALRTKDSWCCKQRAGLLPTPWPHPRLHKSVVVKTHSVCGSSCEVHPRLGVSVSGQCQSACTDKDQCTELAPKLPWSFTGPCELKVTESSELPESQLRS